MITKLQPNFERDANIKNTNGIVTIKLNELSLIFFLIIYCFAITLLIFILEFIINYAKNYRIINNKNKQLIRKFVQMFKRKRIRRIRKTRKLFIKYISMPKDQTHL